jgi:hypothetical protein
VVINGVLFARLFVVRITKKISGKKLSAIGKNAWDGCTSWKGKIQKDKKDEGFL